MDKITVKGFKGFRELVEIELKKITVLFGYNNSGKSALLRVLPTLADSFKKHDNKYYTKSYLNYSSPALRGAIHADIKNSDSREIELGVYWGDKGIQFALRQNALEDEFVHKLELTHNLNAEEYQVHEDNSYCFQRSEREDVILESFNSLSDEGIRTHITQTANSVFWLSSIRDTPPREFYVGLGVNVDINYKGKGVGEALWFIKDACPEAFECVDGWLQATTGRAFKMDSSSSKTVKPGRASVNIQTVPIEGSGSQVDIIDSGEGIAQVLPVVTLCAMAKCGMLGESPIIAIEQPELHLHPKAVINLADFLVACITENDKIKLVLETHSESFLLAIQTAIVKDTLDKNDLSCYWVEKIEGDSSVSKIIIDEEGFINGNWPQSVFREIIAQSKELLQAREDMQ